MSSSINWSYFMCLMKRTNSHTFLHCPFHWLTRKNICVLGVRARTHKHTDLYIWLIKVLSSSLSVVDIIVLSWCTLIKFTPFKHKVAEGNGRNEWEKNMEMRFFCDAARQRERESYRTSGGQKKCTKNCKFVFFIRLLTHWTKRIQRQPLQRSFSNRNCPRALTSDILRISTRVSRRWSLPNFDRKTFGAIKQILSNRVFEIKPLPPTIKMIFINNGNVRANEIIWFGVICVVCIRQQCCFHKATLWKEKYIRNHNLNAILMFYIYTST